ncbi:hypothetical protein FRC97_00175 (plasmid) [Paracidovorax citrulli]|uniref:hypothetical protein n=1 Tax=Paracidovorax citrulli TaxID=80869 RepID=UPI00066454C8|nr:hypothetical protein [Paracidovorax citrulli]QCX13179.1 hypothetical protein APS58_p00035 [Paracidovorax citrulli]UMT93553.1 hypothetical protein FRC97_00175 [Paracidovorax citrulli]
MKKTLIAALTLLCIGMTAQADGLGGLAAKMIEVTGAKMPVLVLGPGVKLNIDGRPGGKVVPVFGDDKCPRDFIDQGPASDGCTFLDKPVVTVHYVEERKLVTEQWKVVSKDRRTYLYRANGAVISQAE